MTYTSEKPNTKVKLTLSRVDFNRTRFVTYHGNIGEIAAEEVLLRNGFDIWLVHGGFDAGKESEKRRYRTSLSYYLSTLLYSREPLLENPRYSINSQGVKRIEEEHLNSQDVKGAQEELHLFFGDKLESMMQYMKKIGVIKKPIQVWKEAGAINDLIVTTDINRFGERERPIYTPDLIAKKKRDFYVIEVKTNTGTNFLRGKRLEGLMLAKDYDFIPMLITLNVKIEMTNLKLQELSRP